MLINMRLKCWNEKESRRSRGCIITSIASKAVAVKFVRPCEAVTFHIIREQNR